MQTPFGDVQTTLWSYKYSQPGKPPGALLSGTITVNRVQYNLTLTLVQKPGEPWSTQHLRLERADHKDAAFPFNARDKVTNVLLPLWEKECTPATLAQAEADDKQKRREEVIARIDALEDEIRQLRQEWESLS